MDDKLLKGRDIAAKLQAEIKDDVGRIKAEYSIYPKMVALSASVDSASQLYLKSQKRVAEKLGILHETVDLPDNTEEEDFIEKIIELNNDDSVHGIIIQMPLPEHIKMGRLYAALSPSKDIEGIHASNLGLLVLRKGKLAPATPLAVMELINASGVDLYGAEVVVVGAGKVVGRPLSLLLMDKMATVTVCNAATSEKEMLEYHVRKGEVVIAAAGKAGLIKGEWIKEGAVVIDVGINHVDGKIVGDVEFDAVLKKASRITPVPGGVGPLTVTILMKNLVVAIKELNNIS